VSRAGTCIVSDVNYAPCALWLEENTARPIKVGEKAIQTDGRQTDALRLALDAASLIKSVILSHVDRTTYH